MGEGGGEPDIGQPLPDLLSDELFLFHIPRHPILAEQEALVTVMATDEEEKALDEKCLLLEQGFSPASCAVCYQGRKRLACRVTLKWEGGKPYRLIKAAHLSRPEHYFSIYQSGCN